MIIYRKLNVSANEYFDYLVNVLYKELKKNGSRAIKKSDLVEGYKFTKTLQQEGTKKETSYYIEKLERPTHFRIVYTNENGQHFVYHQIKAKQKFVIEDEYEEDIITKNWKIRLKAMRDDAKTRKSMAKAVKKMESEIIFRREHLNELKSNEED